MNSSSCGKMVKYWIIEHEYFSLNTQLPQNFSANNVKKLLSKGRGSQLSVKNRTWPGATKTLLNLRKLKGGGIEDLSMANRSI